MMATTAQPHRFGLPAKVASVILATVALWLVLPAIPQDPSYHAFADARAWLGIPYAANVVSSVAFVVVGAVALGRLVHGEGRRFDAATHASLWCIAAGIVGTGIGSAWYHHAPDDAALVWDRLPMTVVFAAIMAIGIAQRVSVRLGAATLLVLVVLGAASIAYWRHTGDLSLYGLVQFGPMAGLLALLALTPHGHDPFPWGAMFVLYALAKAAELEDAKIWEFTSNLLSGHTLKHLLAAASAAAALWPVLAASNSVPLLGDRHARP